jgi:hypothetical protein
MLRSDPSFIPAIGSLRSRLGGPPVVGFALVLVGAGMVAGLALARARAPAAPAPAASDPCELPGLRFADLAPSDRTFAIRRLLACNDLAHDRITLADYQQRTAAIDLAWVIPAVVPTTPTATLPIQWATAVRGVSTQYSPTVWSARQVLGAPDVYPEHGDNSLAWASEHADDRAEWIEVGYASPTTISAVEIYETFNPGAIDRIELITAYGNKVEAYAANAAAPGRDAHIARVDLACTGEPIVGVRVHLASAAVPGWNEIDAIGVVPCTP